MVWISVTVWLFGGVAFLASLWLLGSTWRTLFGNFSPSRRSDGAVFQAQRSSSHG